MQNKKSTIAQTRVTPFFLKKGLIKLTDSADLICSCLLIIIIIIIIEGFFNVYYSYYSSYY